MMGLGRPGDRPAEHEEAVIDRMKTATGRAINECRTAIGRAHLRQQGYFANGSLRDAEIQGQVKDRRLEELNRLMTGPQRTAADLRVVKEWS